MEPPRAAGPHGPLPAPIPPLELPPFASTAPMAPIAAFGPALPAKDGAPMIVATVLAGVAVTVRLGLIRSG